LTTHDHLQAETAKWFATAQERSADLDALTAVIAERTATLEHTENSLRAAEVALGETRSAQETAARENAEKVRRAEEELKRIRTSSAAATRASAEAVEVAEQARARARAEAARGEAAGRDADRLVC
jgi:crotonobetainyl-CoA:carnitine CoA-transferase CaiB-like acyl-CoA transferase